MAHDTPTYALRDGVQVFGFPGGAVLEISRPQFDRYGRLWAQVAARQGEGLLNRERLDLLDGGMRQRFIDAVLRRDGGGDWESRLLFALEHTRATAITDPSVSFGSAVDDTLTRHSLLSGLDGDGPGPWTVRGSW